MVHAFAPGDDWRECRDYVAGRLGLQQGSGRQVGDLPDRSPPSPARRIEQAQQIWHAARDPRGTLVERYLAGRGLELPDHVALTSLRYHPACPWRDEQIGMTIKVPAMIAAMRSLETHQITAVHRTRLTEDGRKVDRRMLGVAGGAAIMLDPVEGAQLAIGEGIESCLAGRQLGFSPVWALASAGAVGAFPILNGIAKLTILGERDHASETAVTACHGNWVHAGRTVVVALPKVGEDMNDALRAAHAGG